MAIAVIPIVIGCIETSNKDPTIKIRKIFILIPGQAKSRISAPTSSSHGYSRHWPTVQLSAPASIKVCNLGLSANPVSVAVLHRGVHLR